MDPLNVVASGAGLVGDVFGGILGHKSEKSQLKEARRQFNEQMDFNKNITQYRVQDALKAGINPLAALGQSANVSPTISSYGGNSAGEAASRAGNRVQRMLESLSLRDTVDDARYKRESRALDLESKRIQNDIDRARLGALGQPGVPHPDDPASPITEHDLLFRVVYDMNGAPRLVVNQDVLENDTDNPGYLSALKNAMTSWRITPTGRIPSNQYRMMLDDMYFEATGRHIRNIDQLYFPMSEALIAAVDKAADYIPRGKR